MTVVNAIFSNFFAFLMCIIMTAFPYAGVELPVIDNTNADCRLNVQMISDTHIEKNEAFRQSFLRTGLRNISNTGCDVDALLIDCDITNYADEASLAKYFEIIEKYSFVPVISVAGNHDIGHAGDRNVTDISREEAKANFVRYRNENMGIESTESYYSCELNGYKFIVIGDDCVNGGHFDAMDISPEQMLFLDRELSEGTKNGNPVFVCCHWPVDEINGQATI